MAKSSVIPRLDRPKLVKDVQHVHVGKGYTPERYLEDVFQRAHKDVQSAFAFVAYTLLTHRHIDAIDPIITNTPYLPSDRWVSHVVKLSENIALNRLADLFLAEIPRNRVEFLHSDVRNEMEAILRPHATPIVLPAEENPPTQQPIGGTIIVSPVHGAAGQGAAQGPRQTQGTLPNFHPHKRRPPP